MMKLHFFFTLYLAAIALAVLTIPHPSYYAVQKAAKGHKLLPDRGYIFTARKSRFRLSKQRLIVGTVREREGRLDFVSREYGLFPHGDDPNQKEFKSIKFDCAANTDSYKYVAPLDPGIDDFYIVKRGMSKP